MHIPHPTSRRTVRYVIVPGWDDSPRGATPYGRLCVSMCQLADTRLVSSHTAPSDASESAPVGTIPHNSLGVVDDLDVWPSFGDRVRRWWFRFGPRCLDPMSSAGRLRLVGSRSRRDSTPNRTLHATPGGGLSGQGVGALVGCAHRRPNPVIGPCSRNRPIPACLGALRSPQRSGIAWNLEYRQIERLSSLIE